MIENIKRFLIKMAGRERGNFLEKLLKIFLLIFSYIYIFFVKVLIFLYKINILRKFAASCSVISIGNISVGGTGKTPFLIYLGAKLAGEGKKIAVVSRGYGEDEVREMEASFGEGVVFKGRNRVAGIKMALAKEHPDYILLDDGFQHWRVKRDLDIVMIDVAKPLGKEKVLPAGFLREPLSHIKRADVVFLTRVDLVSQDRVNETREVLKKIKPDLRIFEILFEPVNLYDVKTKETAALDTLRNKPVGVFCGLGNNEAFVKTLEQANIKVASKVFFLDHHIYNRGDLDLISKDAKEKGLQNYLTTFKDIVKTDDAIQHIEAKVFAVRIAVKFKEKADENKFLRLIPGYLRS